MGLKAVAVYELNEIINFSLPSFEELNCKNNKSSKNNKNNKNNKSSKNNKNNKNNKNKRNGASPSNTYYLDNVDNKYAGQKEEFIDE